MILQKILTYAQAYLHIRAKKTEEGKERQETEEFQGWRASFFDVDMDSGVIVTDCCASKTARSG
jgi:hypothetical protein